jgi:putative intracellular protease/amidase
MVALLLACACGLSEHSSPGARADGPADKASLALDGFDPVLLVAGKEVKGKPATSLTRGGFRYLFVDEANKAKFEKDPERYEIQFQGRCAVHRGAPGRPDVFTVHKGRIYCFACEDCREAFRQAPEKNLERRSVVILVFEGMELLDFAGPAEVFLSAGFQVHTVAATRDPVRCAGLVTLTPNYTLTNCPSADVIVIPGGSTAVSKDKRVTDWVVQSSRQAKATLSVCTGVFVLARAGLLDGKEATTHHGAIEVLRKQFPKITVHADRRIVDNGKLVISAGVSAGIDGALHLVERLSGQSQARAAARYMEYDWKPLSKKKS